MPTVSKDLAEKLKANSGYYSDDPRVDSIIEYDNAFGGVDYGLNYRKGHDAYTPSEFVRNPRVFWKADD